MGAVSEFCEQDAHIPFQDAPTVTPLETVLLFLPDNPRVLDSLYGLTIGGWLSIVPFKKKNVASRRSSSQ